MNRQVALRAMRTLAAFGLLVGAACASKEAGRGAQSIHSTFPAEATSQFQRWLDQYDIPLTLPREGKAIVVNVPAFQLIAFEDGEPVLRSRIIVGTPRNPTPTIDTFVTTVRFRPTWRPTPDMVASGEYVDRRWPPGPSNPLGLAAIRLEPGLLVYLHDTNRRELFDREMRALSHGCIRVQRWDELIAWLLNVDLETVHRWANGRRTFDAPAAPVPVMIRHLTAFPDDRGNLEHFADIYQRGSSDAASSGGLDGTTVALKPETSTAQPAGCAAG